MLVILAGLARLPVAHEDPAMAHVHPARQHAAYRTPLDESFQVSFPALEQRGGIGRSVRGAPLFFATAL